jgi:uncharacterized membrane protein
MAPDVSLWPLLGVAVIIAGFVLRFNPMIVVIAAAVTTAVIAKYDAAGTLAAIGAGFLKTRNLTLALILPLATIGLLERHGLRQHAQAWIQRFRNATAGQLLIVYLAAREFAAALGMTALGGHVQMVRPLIAPMAEGAAESRLGALTDATRYRIRANAAAVDNIGLFFGEDIFIAIGSILLIRSFLDQNGIHVEATALATWAIPTAVCAFVIHGVRLLLLDRSLRAEVGNTAVEPGEP